MAPSPTARLLRTARRRARLSQAELARRAGMPRSVVNAYERGSREPGADALRRLALAAGTDVELATRATTIDPDRAGALLAQVIDLAESLPFRRGRRLGYPRFVDRLSGT